MPVRRAVQPRRLGTLFTVAAVLAMIIAVAPAGFHAAAQQPQTPGQRFDPSGSQQVQCLALGETHAVRDRRTGAMRFVGTEPGRPVPHPLAVSGATPPETAARAYLSVCGSLFGLKDQAAELAVTRTSTLADRRSVVRFQQGYRGIPIMGGELIVHLDDTKSILATAGRLLPDVDLVTTPQVTAAVAARAAVEATAKAHGLAVGELLVTPPALWIYSPTLVGPDAGAPTLVWRTEVTPRTLLPVRELVLVDAARGAVALHFNQVDTALQRQTYTAANTTALPGTLVCSESDPTCAAGDSHAAAAHIYAGDTYNFYLTNHGRDSLDNAGMILKSTVHYGINYSNAFWNGVQMVYGDAAGFPLADDVVGHELTHGVTQFTSNLFYYYQSGAINESLSDVFGEFIDQTNGRGNDSAGVKWLMGEDISGLGAIRSLKDPTIFGDPDKMTSPLYYTAAADGGGVHHNSGLNNKAAYLMVDGGTFNGQTITGLGLTKVAKIYYEVQTHLLTSGADYADLHEALLQGCNNLVGTAGILTSDCQEVRKATLAVEMDKQPIANFNPEAPVCAAGQPVNNVFFDNLESGAGNFVFMTGAGTNRWRYGSPWGSYAHSGTNFLYADDDPAVVDDSSTAMAAGVTLPANAYLRFAHAFGFETPNYDGGVVEYTTNNGATWSDAGTLFDAVGYNGTIATGFSNPLAARPGFVGNSHGYLSSRLNLASLAGQSVRFRWRMGLDSSVVNWGWWLDDVQIYTCANPPAPGAPSTPTPVSGGSNVAPLTPLAWSAANATSYDLYLGTTNPPPLVASGLSSAAYSPALLLQTSYFWKVVARNPGGTTAGPIWSFSTATPPPVLIRDTFTGADGTLLTAHLPDINYPLAVWAVTGSTPVPSLRGNAVGVTAGSGHLQATLTTGVADMIMAADYRVGAGPSLGGFAFRLTDANNHLVLLVFGNTLNFFRKQGGSYTLLATQDIPPVVLGSSHRLELRATGSQLEGWWDGGLVVQTTESFQQTATRHGLDWNSSYDATVTLDNFEIRPAGSLLPGPPTHLSPANGATGIPPASTLSWTAINATSYDIYFGTTDPPPAVATGITSPSYTPVLTSPATYYWQVVANNAVGTTAGPVSSFSTGSVPIVRVSDTFTGANGTPLTAHTPDIDYAAAAWTVSGASTAPTLMNNAVGVTAGSGHLQATLSSGLADVFMAVDYRVGTGPQLGGLVFRFVDTNNHLLLLAVGNSLQFFRRQGGTYTMLAIASIPLPAVGSTHRLEVHASGSALEGWWDGARLLQIIETFQQTATFHGLDWNSAYDPTVTFDNFEIRTTESVPPGTPGNPSPANGIGAVSPTASLTWSVTNASTCDVKFGTVTPPPFVAQGVPCGSYTPPATGPGTTYFWQIIASNGGGSTPGPLWTFTTGASTSVRFVDTFTGANGTLLTAHVPDTNPLAVAWVVTGATPVPTLNNGVVGVSPGSGHLQATLASTLSDVFVSADYRVGAGPQLGGLVFRFADTNNHLLLLANGNALQFYRRQGGNYTLLASQSIPVVAPGSSHRLEVHAVGSALDGWWDGALVVQTTESFQQSATRHGLDWNSAYDATVTFDNLEMRTPGPAWPGIPATPSPAPAATLVSPASTLSWSAANATSYDVYFGTTNPPALVASGITSASYTPSGMTAPTTYYWKVVAINSVGTGVGPVWSFTTGLDPRIIADTFTGATGTLLTAHVPDVNQPGASWLVTGNPPVPTINGGAVGVGAGTGHVQATLTSGIADFIMRTDYRVGAGLQLGGFAFRLTNADNHLLLLAVGNSVQFYRRQAGNYTLLASVSIAPVAAGSSHRLELRAKGAALEGWWDNVRVIQATDSFQQTATRHGLDWNSAYDPTITYDNFEVLPSP